jgi:hypothetical protein
MITKYMWREQWREMVDSYALKLSLVNENQYIISMGITSKIKETWEQESMNEYVLYTLQNWKIIEERFFYKM